LLEDPSRYPKERRWSLDLGEKSKQKYFTGGKSKNIFYRGENQK